VSPGLVPSMDRITSGSRCTSRGSRASIARATAFVIRSKPGVPPQLLAFARTPDEAEASRWQFLARRTSNAHTPGARVRARVVDPDAYAMSFWYDCALIVLLSEPYGIDFVRHRCRQVARELVHLLPMLDPDPEAPAAIRRRPPTLS